MSPALDLPRHLRGPDRGAPVDVHHSGRLSPSWRLHKPGPQIAATDADEERRHCESQLANPRTLFELGDLANTEYVERRDPLQRQIEGLRTDGQVEVALKWSAAFFVDLTGAWRAAYDLQRNALTKLLSKEVHTNTLSGK